MKPRLFSEIIDCKKYDTETAELLAGDDFFDGHNFERQGRNTFLYRTPKGNFFAVHLTCWQGERDRIEPLNKDEAVRLFDNLPEHRVDFAAAFPGVTIEEA